MLFPQKLSEVTKQILSEIPDIPLSIPAERTKGVDFEGLVQCIRETAADQVVEMARKLSLAEVDTLSFRFSEIPCDVLAKRRVSTVLLTRWKPRYARTAWEQFQQNFEDQELIRMVRVGLRKRQIYGLDNAIGARLFDLLHSTDPVVEITQVLEKSGYPFDDGLDGLRISSDTLLGVELLRQYMLMAGPKTYLHAEDPEFIEHAFDLLHAEFLSDYLAVVDTYLTLIEENQFQDHVMQHIYRSLGHPDDENSRWAGIQQENRERFMRWLNLSIIGEFFAEAGDNERFQFWRQFSDVLREARCIRVRDSSVAFLVFDTVFVVEFARKGNAAYVYSRERYEGQFKQYATKKVVVKNESQLKDWNHLRRIPHTGNWQRNRQYDIERLVRGGIRH